MYLFQINEKGNLTLFFKEGDKSKNLMNNQNKYIQNYNINNTYKMGISFNPLNGNIITTINDDIIYSTNDFNLKGNRVGFFSNGKNTVFKQIISGEF